MGQDVRLLKICNFCNKAFIAKNPKAEYDTYNYKNKANVYKSRAKSSNIIHTDKGIAVKLPSDDISEDLVKNINNRNCFDFIVFWLFSEYNISILSKGNLLEGRCSILTSFDLIWRLIVLLLLSISNDESQDKNKE